MPGFAMWNRGKDGVVLDLATDEGRERALALIDTADVLIDTADVLIDGVRGGVQHALGLSPDELHARCPRLVHCTITRFGPASRGRRDRRRVAQSRRDRPLASLGHPTLRFGLTVSVVPV